MKFRTLLQTSPRLGVIREIIRWNEALLHSLREL
jgi:hypothetical protein